MLLIILRLHDGSMEYDNIKTSFVAQTEQQRKEHIGFMLCNENIQKLTHVIFSMKKSSFEKKRDKFSHIHNFFSFKLCAFSIPEFQLFPLQPFVTF